jgi:hypothetical protein
MGRAKISRSTQDHILAECRRRCAFCFALANDVTAKVHGQIAHIDRNPNNNGEENLAYLCLEHANLYDLKSSQSKGFTPGELRAHKGRLLLVLANVPDIHEIKEIFAREFKKLAAELAREQLGEPKSARRFHKRDKKRK